MPQILRRVISLALLALLSIWSYRARADLVISEFLADNASVLADEDGAFSDWIEVKNAGAAALSTLGWYLTDDPDDKFQWAFPDETLQPEEYLVVFASGKDRSEAGRELHANFALDAGGEYLALVAPDGSTAEEFAPEFPEQLQDVSYGAALDDEVTILLRSGATVRWLVPSSPGGLPANWTAIDLADASWNIGNTPIGYDTGVESAPGGPTENVALSKPTSQSSTLGSFTSARGVDGDAGNFTHTAAGVNLPAMWEVDLEDTFSIERIVLHNRDSCCGSRLRDITVSILDESGAVPVWQSSLLNAENALGGGAVNQGPDRIELDLIQLEGAPVVGSRVRVVRTPDPDLSGSGGSGNSDEADVLQLGEVEVDATTGSQTFAAILRTDIEDAMASRNASAFLRLAFEYDPAEFPELDVLTLRTRYDDGFIAHLNGTEIARRSAPPTASWSSTASAVRGKSEAFALLGIDVSAFAGAVVEGTNTLAIQGLNAAAADDDFLIDCELEARTVAASVPRYFATPTPGGENSSDFFGIVEDTKFSVDRGFHETPFEVAIATATAGATVRYTLDGSEPTATHGSVYSGPIPIYGTTVLRAAAFKTGLEPTNVDTQTYIFVDDIVTQDYRATVDAGFPPSWGGTSPDYGMDPDVIGPGDRFGGEYAARIRGDLRSLPSLCISMDTDDLFGPNGIYTNSGSHGVAWERSGSAELIYADGSREGFQVDCGVRIQGGAFRSHGLTKKHSFRLLFKTIHGPSKLRYDWFGEGADDSFDTITLRGGANDGYSWSSARLTEQYTRDEFGRELQRATGQVAAHGTFVHLYLNGVYWGLYNPVERPDHSFSASYFGGEKEDWDSVHDLSATNGDRQAWNAMVQKASQAGASNAAYLELQGRNRDGSRNPALPHLLDVENYVDYLIVNLWGGNWDWPWKNWWAGRHRGPESTGFKFYCWDYENTIGNNRGRSPLDKNALQNDFSSAGEIHQHLESNPEYRLFFGDRVHRLFFNDGPLHPGELIARYEELARTVEGAIVPESARWGDQHHDPPLTLEEWYDERDWILNTYLPQRSAIVLDQLRGASLYPDVEAPRFNRHGGAIEPPFGLVITATEGTVYYTTDGSDPRLFGGGIAPGARVAGEVASAVLVDAGAEATVLVPLDGGLGAAWTDPDFDDGDWIQGPTGVGYERGTGYEDLIATDVESLMYQTNASVYVRCRFTLQDADLISVLRLRMKYDDGFVAYINGFRVAVANAPASPQWNSGATDNHDDAQAVQFQAFDISAWTDALRPGVNVLAIHGLNAGSGSSDLVLVPRLDAFAASEEQAIVLDETTVVKSRALSNGEWSALIEATFVYSTLRVTELMYHPRGDGAGSGYGESDYEFIELRNTGALPMSLEGIRLEGGIEFDFATGGVLTLAPLAYVVVAENVAAFERRYGAGWNVAGQYTGRLSNAGETIRVVGSIGETIQSFKYRDFWFPETDGEGFSLVIADEFDELSSWSEKDGWRPSDVALGSPGESENLVGGRQRAGDANRDGRVDVGDVVALLLLLLRSEGLELPCEGAHVADGGNIPLLDHNGDLTVDTTDAVALLVHLFRAGPAHPLGTTCVRIEGCPDGCLR